MLTLLSTSWTPILGFKLFQAVRGLKCFFRNLVEAWVLVTMVYKEHLPWCFDSLASPPTYFLIRCRQAFIRKFFCQGSNFSKSTKVGPKYVLLPVWDFLRKKILPYKKTSSNNQAGMSLIFPTKPVFIFSKQNWYVSSKDILYFIPRTFCNSSPQRSSEEEVFQ